MAKEARAELARTDEAIKRWEARLTRAMNMLVKLRKQRARWDRVATRHQVEADLAKKLKRERRQQLPPPPQAPGISEEQKQSLRAMNRALNKTLMGG